MRVDYNVPMEEKDGHMVIHDNGNGVAGDEGNGICGMRERVRALGGTLVIESSRQSGTVVRIAIPLTPTDRLLSQAVASAAGTLPSPGPDRLAS